MARSWTTMALVVLMALVQGSVGVSLNLCSSQNTASGSATSSQYQTNGLCSDTCGSSYAFAITQGNNCWCSNYAPADTTSLDDCDEDCPGYPFEQCGSSDGLYGYVALSGKPSGTIGKSKAEPSTTTSTTTSATSPAIAPVVTPKASTVFLTATPSSTTSSTTTPTTSTSDSSEPATETVTRSLITTISSGPGQVQVSTIILTPSATATIDSSPLGQGATNNITTSNGLSKGAVAGLAIGVALGVSLIAGVVIFLLWRRMHQHREQSDVGSNSEMAVGGLSGPLGSVSRHTSTMSSSGLLNKHSMLSTRNLSSGWVSQNASGGLATSPTGTANRRSLGADQRLDLHHAIYTNEDLRHSDVSLQDNTDYSRKILSVRNRGDGELED